MIVQCRKEVRIYAKDDSCTAEFNASEEPLDSLQGKTSTTSPSHNLVYSNEFRRERKWIINEVI
jgi:hypothetical protein